MLSPLRNNIYSLWYQNCTKKCCKSDIELNDDPVVFQHVKTDVNAMRLNSLEFGDVCCLAKWRFLSELPDVNRILVILVCSMVWPLELKCAATGLTGKLREIGSDGSEMIAETCIWTKVFWFHQYIASGSVADNGIDQIPRGAGKRRGNVIKDNVVQNH